MVEQVSGSDLLADSTRGSHMLSFSPLSDGHMLGCLCQLSPEAHRLFEGHPEQDNPLVLCPDSCLETTCQVLLRVASESPMNVA